MSSTANPALVAAAPYLIAALQAIQQFDTDMGAPSEWAANYLGASQKLLGTVELQLAPLINADGNVLQSDINTKVAGIITQLQALVPATTAAA